MCYHHSNVLIGQHQQNDNSKWIGSYSQIPSTKQNLSWKQNEMKIVTKSKYQGYDHESNYNRHNQASLIYGNTGLDSTFKILYLDQLSHKNKSNPNIIKKIFRSHYRIDIKNYLKSKYNKPAFEIPYKAIEIIRTSLSRGKEQQLSHRPWKTQNLYIYKPFYSDNLRKMITENYGTQNKFLLKERILPLIKQLLRCSIQHGGLDNFIMTTSNVYIAKDQSLQINYTSFVGLAFVKGKQAVLAEEFLEIAPYLTPSMIFSSEINTQDKVRFFVINCLSLIRRKDFFYETDSYYPNEEFSFEKAVTIIFDKDKSGLKLKEKFVSQLKKIFENSSDKKRINKAIFANVRELMEDVLIHGKQISWQKIVSMICIPSNLENKFTLQQKQKFVQLHTKIYDLDQNKKFYEERGLHESLVYIPIKFKANLQDVFKFGQWWQVFNPKHSQHLDLKNSNIGFCTRLLKEIVKHREAQTEKRRKQIKSDFVFITLLNFLKCRINLENMKSGKSILSQDVFNIISDCISYLQQ